jgi:hypothetical protein
MNFLRHPKSGQVDVMRIAVFIVVCAAAAKFLLDGVTLQLFGHSIQFGHTDAMSFGNLLTPTLGAHAFTEAKGTAHNVISKVDNPDL